MARRNLSIIEKVPKLEDIAPVDAVIVMMIYSWISHVIFGGCPAGFYSHLWAI